MTQFAVPNTCPSCGHSESWSVWLGVLGDPMGKCHRAKCGFVGSLGPHVSVVNVGPKKKEARYYTRPTKNLTDEQELIFVKEYGLPWGTVRQYSPDDDRFLLRVDGPSMARRGYIARSMSGAEPKTLPYNELPEEPFIHWTYPPKAPHAALVVVEDWFSAEKVSLLGQARAVALNGSHLSEAAVQEIALPRLPTILALDLDAYPKAVGYQQRYAERFPRGLKLWRLRVDLKKESLKNIERALRGVTDNFFDFEGEASI